MKKCELVFQGYTWDDYFHIIADKSGVMVVYKGGLDCEGAIKLDEIVFIGGSEKLNDLYESQDLCEIRRNVNLGDRLFFSMHLLIVKIVMILYPHLMKKY